MVPDIAFQLGPFAPIPPKEDDPPLADMVVFLRDDKESLNTPQRNKRAIRDVLSTVEDGDRISFTIVDWADRLRRYQSNDYFFTDTAIQLLSAGRVLVCDRLHAAILAYLSGIPFVYINQSTGKISKTLRVAFDSGEGCEDGQATMWARADNLTHAVQLANGFLSLYELKPRRKKRRKKKSSRPQ
jgi:exopolysaccharide biosynthesis predicted pyruvyltransferase EpsI